MHENTIKDLFGGEKTFNLGEVCAILKITRPTLNTIIKAKKLGHYRIGQRCLISESQLKQFISEHRVEAAQ